MIRVTSVALAVTCCTLIPLVVFRLARTNASHGDYIFDLDLMSWVNRLLVSAFPYRFGPQIKCAACGKTPMRTDPEVVQTPDGDFCNQTCEYLDAHGSAW